MRRVNRKGIALISVLWLNAVILIIALGIIRLGHTQAAIVLGDEKKAIAVAAIEGALLASIDLLARSDPASTQFPIQFERQVGSNTVAVKILPETGKVDVNMASAAILREFFRNAGASASEAQRIAAAVIDWRDADVVAEYFGAEATSYIGNSAGMLPRNAPIESLGELRWVMGMSPELYDCIEGLATVHAHSTYADVANLTSGRQSVSDAASRSEKSIVNVERSMAGHAYTIDLRVIVDDHATNYEAIVRMTGVPGVPFWLLAWSETIPDAVECRPH